MIVHMYESIERRRARLHSEGVYGQALCGTGDAHQVCFEEWRVVTCPRCLANKDTTGYWGS